MKGVVLVNIERDYTRVLIQWDVQCTFKGLLSRDIPVNEPA